MNNRSNGNRRNNSTRSGQGSCGNTPKRDGSGGGYGNRSKQRHPKR